MSLVLAIYPVRFAASSFASDEPLGKERLPFRNAKHIPDQVSPGASAICPDLYFGQVPVHGPAQDLLLSQGGKFDGMRNPRFVTSKQTPRKRDEIKANGFFGRLAIKCE